MGQRQIAVNVVRPGAIKRDLAGGLERNNPELNNFIASQTALGRGGLTDDIEDTIAALLSEETRWVNAQLIKVSDGVFL